MEISETGEGVVFRVRVVPRASKTELAGEIGGAVKVRVASPPVDGAANAELVKFLAKKLGVARSSVEVVAGHASREKRIFANGVTAERVRTALG